MSGYIGSLDVGTVMPAHEWAQTPEFRGAVAHVATLPDGELIADVLGLNLRPVRGVSSR